ncbi:MAG TPA: STAS domain-containing protein [Spirochaetota bacterium]|nr:STAS domain-containing protein [Spirochaetota bacterium]
MDNSTWKFPEEIDFCSVPQYISRLEREKLISNLVFDLTNTKKVHSSFIGFLIFVKNKVEENGGNLTLKTSPSLQKTLMMMNVSEYFSFSSIINTNNAEPLYQQVH